MDFNPGELDSKIGTAHCVSSTVRIATNVSRQIWQIQPPAIKPPSYAFAQSHLNKRHQVRLYRYFVTQILEKVSTPINLTPYHISVLTTV